MIGAFDQIMLMWVILEGTDKQPTVQQWLAKPAQIQPNTTLGFLTKANVVPPSLFFNLLHKN